MKCKCSSDGQSLSWSCLMTEACMMPDCEESLGPKPSCDYSVSDRICFSDSDCSCGKVCHKSYADDFSICGCEINTSNGCDPKSSKPWCYEAYSMSGFECGCRDDNDCGKDETCGISDSCWNKISALTVSTSLGPHRPGRISCVFLCEIHAHREVDETN